MSGIEKSAQVLSEKPRLFSDSTGKYSLYTTPFDTCSEQARWSLDRHQADYVDIDLPWGLYWWETLNITPNDLSIPLLVNQKAEKFSSVTQITMYLYAQAFSGKIRLYANAAALDEQEYFDATLVNACRVIYLDSILKNKDLTKKYIVEANHLRSWKILHAYLWRFLQWVYILWFGLYSSKTLENAWNNVYKSFDRVEELRKTNKSSKYLVGDSITAADIAFASHVSLLLLPSNLGLQLPPLGEMSASFQEKTRELSKRDAAKFAIEMYQTERGPLRAKKLDKEAKEYNPEWAVKPGKLRVDVMNLTMMCVIPFALPLLTNWDWLVTISYWVIVSRVFYGYFTGAPLFVKKVAQLTIAAFSASKQ